MRTTVLAALLLIASLFIEIKSDDFGSFESSSVIIGSEKLVGATITIGGISLVVSEADLIVDKRQSQRLEMAILQVSAGMHGVTITESGKPLLRTRVSVHSGQSQELRLRR